MLDAGSPVRRFDVRSQDPEFAHQELRDAYADFAVRRRSGSRDGFRFVHSGIVAPEFMVGQVRYGMAAELDVRVPETSLIVAANAGGRIEIRTDRETVRPDIGTPLLMPSHAGWQVGMDDVTVNSFVIDLSAVRRMALSTFGSDPDQLRFTSMTPTARALRYWLDAVEHVRRDVLDDDAVSSHRLGARGGDPDPGHRAAADVPEHGTRRAAVARAERLDGARGVAPRVGLHRRARR